MYCVKKYNGLVVSVLLLFSSIPAKSEPVTFIVGAACLGGGALIGYLCSGSKEVPASPELAATQAEHFQQEISGEHRLLIQANAQRVPGDFRRALHNHYQSAGEVDKYVERLRSDQCSLRKKLEQLQQVRDKNKNLTKEQLQLLREKEEVLKQLYAELRDASQRFEDNKQYFNLHARLNSVQNMTSSVKGTYPILKKIERIEGTCDQLEDIKNDAKRLGFNDLVSRASQIRRSLHQEQYALQNDPLFRIEKQAQLEHESRMQCEAQRNKELARQAEKNRAVHLQEVAQLTYRNKLRQQEIDLEEGRVRRRVEDQFRGRLNQAERTLRRTQGDLSKIRKERNEAFSRNRQLERDKAECARRTAELKEKLKLALRREREQASKNMSRQEPTPRCMVEGCIIEGCTGNHPVPSAPPYQEGERPSSPVSAPRNTAGGPPPTAHGIKR